MILLKPKLFLFLLLPLCLFLTFNKHSKDKVNSYHGVIWSDAAGYYVYNPIWFIYGNNAAAFPDSIEAKTGNGFSFDLATNKVVTKYPSGVALMQAPFFLLAHALAEPLGYKADGFSRIYSFGLFLAGIVYCCLGLFFISNYLSRYFSPAISIIGPILFFVGTNLFYYSIDAPGMSHVYSFFLFSLIVYLSPIIISQSNYKFYILFFICMVLVVLTRPTNVLIALFPLLFHLNNKTEIIQRIKYIISQKVALGISAIVAFAFLLPQLFYWKTTMGKFLSYSYKNEGFDYWTNPKLLEVWFAAKNGLFTYSPLLLLSIAGIVLLIKDKRLSGYFFGGLFLLISFVFASWWCWWFGCSFGSRSFIEYYAVFIIPFCYVLKKSVDKKYGKALIIVLIGLCCYLNMDMEYYYDGCFYGDTWDFASYFKLLNS